MNPNYTTSASETADDRYDACEEKAAADLTVDALFEELTDAERNQLVCEALLGRPTTLFAGVAGRVMCRQRNALIEEAKRLARVSPLAIDDWYTERLIDEAALYAGQY